MVVRCWLDDCGPKLYLGVSVKFIEKKECVSLTSAPRQLTYFYPGLLDGCVSSRQLIIRCNYA